MTTIPALFKKIVAANDLYDTGALNCEHFLESLKLVEGDLVGVIEAKTLDLHTRYEAEALLNIVKGIIMEVQSDVNHSSALFSGVMTICLVAVFAYTLVGYVV
jgi:transcriptional antiterminator Rof (Rho-off)